MQATSRPHSVERFRASSRRLGFTLVELLVVVLILGIMAAISMPTFRRTVERGYFRQAQDLLLTIYSGQRAYFFLNNFYLNNPSTMVQWRQIHVDDPNIDTSNLQISVAAAGSGAAATFTITATRQGGATNPCNGQTLTVDQVRTFNPSGAACWVSCGC